MLKSCYFLEK